MYRPNLDGTRSLEKPLSPQRKDFRPRRLMQCVGQYLYLRRPLQRHLAHYFRLRRDRRNSRLAINAMYRPNLDGTRSLEKPLTRQRKDFRPRRLMQCVRQYLYLRRALLPFAAQSLKYATHRRRLTLALSSALRYTVSVKFGVWSLEKPLSTQHANKCKRLIATR